MGRLVGLSLDQSEPGPGGKDQSMQGSGQVAANQGGAWVKSLAVGH